MLKVKSSLRQREKAGNLVKKRVLLLTRNDLLLFYTVYKS